MAQDWLSRWWGESLAEDVDVLLSDLCVGWGYCNGSVSAHRLLREGGGTVTAEAVASATVDADGDFDPDHREAIERLFRYRYGARSITEADFPPAADPYDVAPDAPDRDRAREDPVLLAARGMVCGPSQPTDSPDCSLSPEAVMDSIRRVRNRKAFAVGPTELEAGKRDFSTLIAAHERLTGRCWNADPGARLKLGLGPQPGELLHGA